MPKVDGLTFKEQRFVTEVLRTGNLTEAARRAYGVKDSTARHMGSENYAKARIRDAIDQLLAQNDLLPTQVIQRLRNIIVSPQEGDQYSVTGLTVLGNWTGLNSRRFKREM